MKLKEYLFTSNMSYDFLTQCICNIVGLYSYLPATTLYNISVYNIIVRTVSFSNHSSHIKDYCLFYVNKNFFQI